MWIFKMCGPDHNDAKAGFRKLFFETTDGKQSRRRLWRIVIWRRRHQINIVVEGVQLSVKPIAA